MSVSEYDASIAVTCPVCGGVVEILAPDEGFLVECQHCKVLLKLAQLEPLLLAVVSDHGEVPFRGGDEGLRAS